MKEYYYDNAFEKCRLYQSGEKVPLESIGAVGRDVGRDVGESHRIPIMIPQKNLVD
jgi:hypothetical protein